MWNGNITNAPQASADNTTVTIHENVCMSVDSKKTKNTLRGKAAFTFFIPNFWRLLSEPDLGADMCQYNKTYYTK